MLLEEFIEQHGVHLIVANTVGFTFFVAHDQIRIPLVDVFGHKSELRCACRINVFLVAERHRPKSKEASLALSIGWISSLNRADEVVVPSLPLELMRTAIPLGDVEVAMFPIKQLSSTLSPMTPAPIQITLSAIETALPASNPMAMLLRPVVLPRASQKRNSQSQQRNDSARLLLRD